MYNPLHKNLQTTTSVYCQNGNQTTGSGHDSNRNETRHALKPKENLINWTVTRVDDHSGDWIHQWLIRQIAIYLCNFALAHRHGEIERGTAVSEDRVDHYETTAEFRVPDHNRAIVVMLRVHPIVLDMLDAYTDISPVKNQRTVLNENHHTIDQRAGKLQHHVSVFDFEHDVEDARDEEKDNQTEADHVHQYVCISLYQRRGFE